MRLLFLALIPALSLPAQVCGPNELSGPYGFQLSGTTTISGTATPVAAIGRLTFDGGKISGTSSVNFNGLFLGNPVTGTYELQTDCSLKWSLQDDSGGWQHFAGTLRPGGDWADFRQSDRFAGSRGVLIRAPAACDATAFRGRYRFTMDGISTPLASRPAGEKISEATITVADGNGRLSWQRDGSSNSGDYQVDSDCFVQLNFGVKLRGILVDGGKTVVAVQTDPEQVAIATFSRQ